MKQQEKALNKLLATLSVFEQALYTMHWQIDGPKFHEFHAVTQSLYEEVEDMFDAVAERIMAIGGKPVVKLSDYVKLSSIPEFEDGCDWEVDVTFIGVALQALVSNVYDVVDAAKSESDEASVSMAGTTLEWLQKKIWMNSAYSRK
jgi:starvation-inducible DNA-binding protein